MLDTNKGINQLIFRKESGELNKVLFNANNNSLKVFYGIGQATYQIQGIEKNVLIDLVTRLLIDVCPNGYKEQSSIYMWGVEQC